MKKFVLSAALVLCHFVIFAQEADKAEGPYISFQKDVHDFGDIIQGEKVNTVFKFTNTGIEPLVLSNVLTTCGCTATDWPKEPIEPGKSEEIAVTFNSSGKMGKQNKVVRVVSNASNDNATVRITTNVLPKKEE